MRTKFTLVLCCLFFLSLGLNSCYTTKVRTKKYNKAKTLPPGQAKKVYGSKSAKPFAPGQNKKK